MENQNAQENTEQKQAHKRQSIFKNPWVQTATGIILIALAAGSVLLYKILSTRVSIDDSLISAPVISIGPETAGILEEVDVKPGDSVVPGQILAHVGGEVLYAQVAGLVIDTANMPGQVFMPTQSVVSMIDPGELRVVGTIKETEGLSKIKVGDPVWFTVDAFSGQKYSAVIDSVSPNAKEAGVAFSISDKREVQEFEVKAKFDAAAHPEFKNGMSAKMKVYVK